MPTIQLTDSLGLDVNVDLAPYSSLLKYFQQLPALRLASGDLSKAAGLTLEDPALTALHSGFSFDKPVTAGPGGTDISIAADAHGLLELIRRTPAQDSLSDVLSDTIEIAEGTCFVGFGLEASIGASLGGNTTEGAGTQEFGVGPSGAIEAHNYQSFPLHQGITLLDAVRKTVGNFIIPARAEDLMTLPDGCVATVTCTGSLQLSATADLLAVTNPLASATLPSPLPSPSVTAGGTVEVGASLELSCTFQICARTVGTGRVQLGWYRDSASEFDVTATVSEGVSAGFGSTDLFSSIIAVVSTSASADLDQLQKAGLGSGQIDAIQSAVKSAVNRKLELSLAAEIGAAESSSAMFLFELDVAALTAGSRQAIDLALRGDLTALHSGALPGISTLQSAWEKAKSRSIRLQVNLLGILNFTSISELATSGAVMVEPATGTLVVTDKATAERIRSTAVNFGANTAKLRHVLAESFLLTATYQGLQHQVGEASMSCSHDFFDLQNSTTAGQMGAELRVGAALGLFSEEDAATPAGIADFGCTTVHATAQYSGGVAETLFLSGGESIAAEFYENMGRAAIQLLVGEHDVDAVRRTPAIDNDLWNRMKDLGQPGFPELFPGVPAPLLGAITADYSAIVWWAAAMAGASKRLAAVHDWFGNHPKTSLDDPEFQSLRQDLASHLKQVAATTSERFGEPWGLIAMDQASGRRATAGVLITGPKLVRSQQRTISAAARS